jgi:hypothetical protein
MGCLDFAEIIAISIESGKGWEKLVDSSVGYCQLSLR